MMNARSSSSRLMRKKEATARRIISVSMGLFLDQGIDATSMEQIAEEADVAKGTLYNYFPAKEAIIDGYIKQSFVQLYPQRIERLRSLPDTRSRMQWLLHELLSGMQAQRELFERYFIYRIQQMISLHPGEDQQSGLYALELELLELGQQGGEIRNDLPAALLSGLFEFVFIKLAQVYYQAPQDFDEPQAISNGIELFLQGVSQSKSDSSEENVQFT